MSWLPQDARWREMSHDLHFLERTIDESRLSLPAMERAMLLYRDPELLRFIFEKARLPEGMGDIAIALTTAEEPPHLVVHRSGHFRTILGPGMPFSDAQLLPYDRFQGLVDQMAEFKGRLSAAERLTGVHGSVGKLLLRLSQSGPYLSREEFIAVSHWQPLLRNVLASLLADSVLKMETLRSRLRRIYTKRLEPRNEAALRRYWEAHYFAQHVAVLIALDHHRHTKKLPVSDDGLFSFFSSTLFGLGTIGAALRLGWIAGELGKDVLGEVKRLYMTTHDHWRVIVSAVGLLGIAGRRSRTHAEIAKVLDTPLRTFTGEVTANVGQLISYLRDLVALLEKPPEEIRQDWLPFATADFVRQHNPAYRTFAGIAEFKKGLPTELYFAAAAQSDQPLTNPADVIFLLSSMPVVATVEPKELYFPELALSLLRRDWVPQDTVRILEAQEQLLAKPEPVRATPKPGANDLCPCGSGKKYKRCCRA